MSDDPYSQAFKLLNIDEKQKVDIPIEKTIRLRWKTTVSDRGSITNIDTDFYVLFPSGAFRRAMNKDFLYIEMGSKNRFLNLIDPTKVEKDGWPFSFDIYGATYERHGHGLDIKSIQLNVDNILETAYEGTVEDLLALSHITRPDF